MAGASTARNLRRGALASSDQVNIRSFTAPGNGFIDAVETSAASVNAFVSAGWVPNTTFLKAGDGGYYLPIPSQLALDFGTQADTLTVDIVGRNHLDEVTGEQIVNDASGTDSKSVNVYRFIESITPVSGSGAGTFQIGFQWFTGDEGALSVPIPIKIRSQSDVKAVWVTNFGGGACNNLDLQEVIVDADAPTTAGTLEAAVNVGANVIQILTTTAITQPTGVTEWSFNLDPGLLQYG